MLQTIKLLIFTLFACISCSWASAGERENIIIYYSAESEFQTSTALAISKLLLDGPLKIKASIATDHDLSKAHSDNLIISLGNTAGFDDMLSKRDNPVIRVNDMQASVTSARQNKNYTNIKITQPLCRYLHLIKIIDSKWERIGYLSASENDERLQQLTECASRFNFEVISDFVTDDKGIPAATDKLLRDSDVLLALPDSKIYNRHSVKNILLSAYRHRIPVIGFSDNFVRAGALASVYSTTDQLARQVSATVIQYMSNEASGIYTDTFPDNYSVSINTQVAKSLDIDVKDETQIEKLMHAMEAAQ